MRCVLGLMIWLLSAVASVADPMFEAKPFDTLAVSSGVTVRVSLANTYDIRVVTRRGEATRLRVAFEGNVLSVSRDMSWGPDGEPNRDRFDVYVTTPNLQAVSASSGAHVIVNDMTARAFSAQSEKGAFIELPGLEIENIALVATTGGDIRADGKCGNMTAIADTGAMILADHLECSAVDASSASGAVVRVFGRETAELSATDGATLVLSGTARVQSQTVERWAIVRNWSSFEED